MGAGGGLPVSVESCGRSALDDDEEEADAAVSVDEDVAVDVADCESVLCAEDDDGSGVSSACDEEVVVEGGGGGGLELVCGGGLAELLVVNWTSGQSASTPLFRRKTPMMDVSGTLTLLQFVVTTVVIRFRP